MDNRNIELAQATALLGADMKDFVRHPGFQVLKRHIDSKISDAKNTWLHAKTSAEAEEIRLSIKPYQDIEDFLKKLVVEGMAAEHNIRLYAQEIKDLQ